MHDYGMNVYDNLLFVVICKAQILNMADLQVSSETQVDWSFVAILNTSHYYRFTFATLYPECMLRIDHDIPFKFHLGITPSRVIGSK